MDGPEPHPHLLFFIPLFLGVQGLVTAVAFARRAPAVSIALASGIAAGVVRVLVDREPQWLPIGVMTWASVALWLGGVVGLIITNPRAPTATTRRWAIGFAASAFPAAVALGLVLVQMCPPYVNRGAGACWWGDQDLAGGWISVVSIAMFLDIMFIAIILGLSAWQAGRAVAETEPTSTQHGRRADPPLSGE